MFSDGRSKRIVLVAHCVLNQNAVSDGTAEAPGSLREAAEALCAQDAGVIQLPCPELRCLGLDRGDPLGGHRPVLDENTRIRAAMSSPSARARLGVLARSVVVQMEEYLRFGFELAGLVGINRSPSCGVDTTSRGTRELPGKGLFVEALLDELKARGIVVNAVGITGREPNQAVATIRDLCSTAPQRGGAR